MHRIDPKCYNKVPKKIRRPKMCNVHMKKKIKNKIIIKVFKKTNSYESVYGSK